MKEMKKEGKSEYMNCKKKIIILRRYKNNWSPIKCTYFQ